MLNFNIQSFFKIVLIISVFSIVSAFYIEYILGHQPCNLCLIERIPYILSIFLIVLNHIFIKKDKFLIILLFITFIASFIISIYHFGIEQGFFNESTICGVKNTNGIISKEELLKQLNEKIISCKDVTFRILGFSLSSINIILSFVIICLLLRFYVIYEKIK